MTNKKINLQDFDLNKDDIFKTSKEEIFVKSSQLISNIEKMRNFIASSENYSLDKTSLPEINFVLKGNYDDNSFGSFYNSRVNYNFLDGSTYEKTSHPKISISETEDKFRYEGLKGVIKGYLLILVDFYNGGNNINFDSLKSINLLKNIFIKKTKNEKENILGYILFHELGHYIHFSWQNKSNNNIIPYTDEKSIILNCFLKNEGNHKNTTIDDSSLLHFNYGEKSNNYYYPVRLSVVESFADVFSLSMMDQFYSKEDSLNMSKRVLKSRHDNNLRYGNVNYNNIEAIKNYIKNRDTFKSSNIDNIVNNTFKISKENAFNYFSKRINNDIKFTLKNIYKENKYIEDNIYDILTVIKFIEGSLNKSHHKFDDFISYMENNLGFKNIKDFIYHPVVQSNLIKNESTYNSLKLLGKAKRYYIDRVSHNMEHYITDKEESLNLIKKDFKELKESTVLEINHVEDYLILNCILKHVDIILDKMKDKRLLNQEEILLFKEENKILDLRKILNEHPFYNAQNREEGFNRFTGKRMKTLAELRQKLSTEDKTEIQKKLSF